VFVSDVDVIWFRNPTPFIQRYPEGDLLISSDFTYPSVGAEEALEIYDYVLHLYFNVGESVLSVCAAPGVSGPKGLACSGCAIMFKVGTI
jgi:hypothetical protein